MPDDRSTATGVLLWVDLPTPGAATAGALVISGWAFRRGGARIVEIEARVGSHRTAVAQGVHRPDVALALGEPHADWSGFEGTLEIEESATERADRLVVRATDESGDFAEVEVPVRVLPSGRPVIEVERARWDGERIELEGWIIWPESVAPRRLEIQHDGTPIAEATPNLSRPDVARRFPAFPPGSCRGFRASGALALAAVPTGSEARLRLVFTDARNGKLERELLVGREPNVLPPGRERATSIQIERALEQARQRIEDEPVVLDWDSGVDLAALFPALSVVRPPIEESVSLPYLDHTMELVVTSGASDRADEARRVARVATIEGGVVRWREPAARSSALAEASIVVVVHGNTANAAVRLDRLMATLPEGFRGEVLVVDDCSFRETGAQLRRQSESWPKAKVLRNEWRVGFERSCNRGAEAARFGVLVFLDADYLPGPRWLPPLLRLLAARPWVGAAGGKLLDSDGTLREAGGLLFSDGSVSAFGCGDDRPDDPRYGFVREVDYCSSAFLAVRRSAFRDTGGFDPRTSPTYDAGVDLALRLRRIGWRTCYQPASVAARVRGAVPGRRSPAPPDRREPAQRQLFRARWRRQLEAQPAQPERNGREVLRRPQAPHGGPRVLVCGPRMPEYDRESGALRLLHLVELLQESGWAVSYLGMRSTDGERYVRLLQQRGVATYAGPDSILAGDEYLDDADELIAGGRFELAIIAFWSIAEALLPRFRSLAPATRVVVDSVDLHYLREERAARVSRLPEPDANARLRLERKRRELATYGAADAVLTVSDAEAEVVSEALGRTAAVHCVPDLEGLGLSPYGFRERSGLLFIGNFHHPPNLEALEYLCGEILPQLEPALLAAHPLSVVGNGTDEHVMAATARIPGARVIGWVPSVTPYQERALVSVVPLLHGAGTKRKLVQSLMVGTPSVSTSIGVEGLELEHGRHALIADSAPEFAAAIRRLASDSVLWDRLASQGRTHIERLHGRSRVSASLRAAIDSVMTSETRRPAAGAG